MSMYKCISNFGQGAANTPANNPLTYCLAQTIDNEFTHGGIGKTINGVYGKNCQTFMSQYCSNKWDDVCEYASNNRSISYPNNIQNCETCNDVQCNCLTSGELLIQNTATRKYLTEMLGGCNIKYEPFDPTVASSPMISYWSKCNSCNTQGNNNECVPVYEVNPKTIDSDPVMNKILNKPIIALALLVNIYNTAKRKRTLDNLKGTKIYNLFMSTNFQKYIKHITPFNPK